MLVHVFQGVFAVGVLVAGAALAAAAFGVAGRRALLAAAGLIGGGALAAWVACAVEPSWSLAIAATGMLACEAAAVGAIALEQGRARAYAVEARIAVAERELDEHVAKLVQARAEELERTIARTRSESVSLLVEHERRFAEERRAVAARLEREVAAQLSETLTGVQRRVEGRLQGWTEDLERAQASLGAQLAALTQRHEQLISEAETRMRTEIERLSTDSEEQRLAVARLRVDLDRAAHDAVTAASAELEGHAAERRRALRELSERLQRREAELTARIEREESEALRRIQSSFGDVERRQVEQLKRVVERTAERFAELAGQQFEASIRSAREEAAKRLSRELDRSVEAFSRDAKGLLAEELARVTDAGAQRVDKRLSQITAGLERQRDEFVASLEQRLGQIELEFRTRVQSIADVADADRAVLEERLQALQRRIDDAAATARARLG